MIPYFVLLGIWLVGAIQFSSKTNPASERILYVAALVFTIGMVGLRYRVGGDWFTYEDMYADIALQPLLAAATLTEPAYALLNWASAKVGGDVYMVNFFCALVFMLGLSALVRKQPKPWLAMTVAIPYLVIVVGMGYTRQAAAIGILCWAISTAGHDKVWKIVAKVAFAALFHKTAILFLPILLAPVAKRSLLLGIVGGIAFVALAFVALGGSSDRLVTSYVNSNYQSSGAAIRITMNVAAALCFFAFRKRFMISEFDRLIWTILSYMAILSAAALMLTSSSVGVDRISLFLIPLQIFTYSNISSTQLVSHKTRAVATIAIVIYSFIVQYVYFTQGTFSYTWLPYRNILIADTSADS